MRRIILITAISLTLISCTNAVPPCSDNGVLETVGELINEGYTEKLGNNFMTAKVSKKVFLDISLSKTREIQEYNSNLKKRTCSASGEFSIKVREGELLDDGMKAMFVIGGTPIGEVFNNDFEYTIQQFDDGEIYVQILQ